jgi:hypothetical protein
MTETNAAANTPIMTTTTDNLGKRFRGRGGSLFVASSLLLMPCIAAHAVEDERHESAIYSHAKHFGAVLRQNGKTVGAGCKDGAHRIAVAVKGVGHEIAFAAKRGAAETRAAFRPDKKDP